MSEDLNKNSVKSEVSNDNASRSMADVNSLCSRLNELKRMPYKDKVAGDPIYDGLKEKGREAIPCLVEKITDVTLMDDPREAPHIHDFRVGDAAVFMLHRITEEPIEKILPDDVREQWETRGIYAYFTYVEKRRNREKIQLWWKDWMKENIKK